MRRLRSVATPPRLWCPAAIAAEAQDRARRADDAVEAGALDALDVLADLGFDVAHELALVARRDRVRLTNRSVSRITPSLKLRPALDRRPRAARDLDAAAADVDHDQDLAGRPTP